MERGRSTIPNPPTSGMQSWNRFASVTSTSRSPSASSSRAGLARKIRRVFPPTSGVRCPAWSLGRKRRSRQRRRGERTTEKDRKRQNATEAGGDVPCRPSLRLSYSVVLRRTLSYSCHKNAQGSWPKPAPLCAAAIELLLLCGLLCWLLLRGLLCSLFLGSHDTSSWKGGSVPGDSPVNRWVTPPRHHDGILTRPLTGS